MSNNIVYNIMLLCLKMLQCSIQNCEERPLSTNLWFLFNLGPNVSYFIFHSITYMAIVLIKLHFLKIPTGKQHKLEHKFIQL